MRSLVFFLLLASGTCALQHQPQLRTLVAPRSASVYPPRSTSVRAVALPGLPALAAACTLPTCLGFWKTEYGVSYAYGAATAICGTLVLRAAPVGIAAAHALCVLAYGVRLNAFLLWRELSVERFRSFREKIEDRSKAQGGRLKRAPFVLSCSLLYYCMCSPLLVTATLAPQVSVLWPLKVSVALAWGGFAVAAWGDAYKSIVKARLGEDALVTTGIFRFLRHPNYTGEQLLWTSNLASGVAAACLAGGLTVQVGAWLAASIVGWAGIMFVLAQATRGLEKKQLEKGVDGYDAWKASTWGGISL